MNREEGPRNGQGPRKERETKEDGRYIIFYTFVEDEGEAEPSKERGAG